MTKECSDEYKFSKAINRLRLAAEIPLLFDGYRQKNYSKNSRIYRNSIYPSKFYGKIAGIPVKITFSQESSCRLHAKTEEDLKIAHKEILDILSGK